MSKGNKWLYVYVIQGNYGQGFEDVCEETQHLDALVNLRLYCENEPKYPHRMIQRRERNPEYKEA